MLTFVSSLSEFLERQGQRRFFAQSIFAAMLILGLCICATGWNIGYYGDSFRYIFNDPQNRIWYFFAHPNPYDPFYRPTMFVVVMLSQWLEGMNSYIIHTVQFLAHISCAFLVFWGTRTITKSITAGVLAGVYMLCAESNGLAIFNIGALSQSLGTLPGYMGLLLLWRFYQPSQRQIWLYTLSLGCFVLAIISKETSMSFLPMTCMLIAIMHSGGSVAALKTSAFWRNCLRDGAAFVLIGLGFLLLRKYVIGIEGQPTLGKERYDMNLGLNLAINVGRTIFAILQPLSTADVFVALKSGQKTVLAGAVALFSLLGGIATWGIILAWRNTEWRKVIVSALLILPFSMMPMMFLNHAGELYSYNTIPVIALLLGLALTALLQALHSVTLKSALLLGFLGILAINIASLHRKADGMKENARQAALYLPQILPIVEAMPKNGHLILINTATPRVEYSTVHQRGFSVFRFADGVFKERTGRFDIRIDNIEPDSVLANVAQGATTLILANDSTVIRKP
jgi:hypothetical protein